MSDAEPESTSPSRKEQLSKLAFEKPTELIAALTAIPTLFYGLGLLTQASRESLIGLYLPLAYPHQNAVLVSLDVLWSLPWHTLTALFVGSYGSKMAWFLVAILAGLFWGQRWLSERNWKIPALPLAVGLAWVLLLLVISNYRAALHPQHVPDGLGAAFEIDMGPSFAQQFSTESISWLKNASPLNDDRRAGLAGLSGWLLLAIGGLAMVVRRHFGPWPVARGISFGALIVLLVLVIGDLPRAHVIATWGAAYPSVQIRTDESCDTALRTAIEQRTCCVYDVSAGGSPRVTLSMGSGCPTGSGFRTWSEEAGHCLLTGPRRVTDAGDC